MKMTRSPDEQELIFLINHTHRAFRRTLNRVLAAQGISDSQAVPIRLIAILGDGVRQGVLAEHIGVEGPSLVRQLDQLCTAGVVERREDPHDRRGRTLHLTPQGRELASRVEAIFRDLRGRLLEKVSDDDLTAALRVLSIFDDALSQAEAEAKARD